MTNHKNNQDNGFWSKLKNTETYKSLQENTEQIKNNYKENYSDQKKSQANKDKLHQESNINHKSSQSDNLLSRSEYQKSKHQLNRSHTKPSHRNRRNKSEENVVATATPLTNTPLESFDQIYGLIKKYSLMAFACLLILTGLVGGVGYGYFYSLLSSETEVSEENLVEEVASVTSTSSIHYRDGSKIADLRNDLQRNPIPLDDMAPVVLEAVIATEDSHFTEHDGVVVKSILRAVFEQVTNSGNTGGSTITQQLVKQQLLSNETTFERKANEIALAKELETQLSKEEILEIYMNVSPFGRNNRGKNIAGINEASQGIFGVDPNELNTPQAAYLAGLPKSPIEYSPYDQNGQIKEDLSAGLQRYQDVLFFMLREGYITETEYAEAESYDITQDFNEPLPAVETERSYLYDELERRARDIILEKLVQEDGLELSQVEENPDQYNEYYLEADYEVRNGGYEIVSTIDQNIYQAINQTVVDNAWYLGSPRDVYWTNEETGETEHLVDQAKNGTILLDNESGQILAFVGGIDFEDNNLNHATQARRSPASVLKPFSVYGPALELGVVTPASMVYDGPISISLPGPQPDYEPKNAAGFSNRWWNVREALSNSQNIPAVRIYSQMYQNHDIRPYFRNAGLMSDAIPDQDFDTLSLALGGVTHGTTVEEMVGAFASIARDGQYLEPYMISEIKDGQGETIFKAEDSQTSNEVFREDTAFLLQDILRETSLSGTAQSSRQELNTNMDLISKTGTSDNTRDIWYIASTPSITLGTWMGYSNIMETNDLSTEFDSIPSNRNQRIWSRIMNSIYAVNPEIVGADQEFDQPDSIVVTDVLESTGMKPGEVTLANGETVQVDGSSKTEFFLPEFVPGTTVYDFAIDGTERELRNFWDNYVNRSQSSEENEDENSDSDEESDDDDENENDNGFVDDVIDSIRDQLNL